MTEFHAVHATEPATFDRPNEDHFRHAGPVAVLLDGAGSLAEVDSGCRHGVAWYVHRLAEHLVHAAAEQRHSLTDALAAAIEATAALHAGTCDLRNPSSPSSTVVAVRADGDRIDYLVLADSTLLYGRPGDAHAVTDSRLDEVVRQVRTGTKTERDRRRYMEQIAEHRNQPGGFWVAGTRPEAAQHAYTGTVPAVDAPHIALLTDGATRPVDLFGLTDWGHALALLTAKGPDAYLRRVRAIEDTDPDRTRWPRSKHHDDATAALLSWPTSVLKDRREAVGTAELAST